MTKNNVKGNCCLSLEVGFRTGQKSSFCLLPTPLYSHSNTWSLAGSCTGGCWSPGPLCCKIGALPLPTNTACEARASEGQARLWGRDPRVLRRVVVGVTYEGTARSSGVECIWYEGPKTAGNYRVSSLTLHATRPLSSAKAGPSKQTGPFASDMMMSHTPRSLAVEV